MAGRLILVGTPIGNIGDITKRAEEALRESDFIIAEDTRVTGTLLSIIGINKKLVSCNGITEESKTASIIPQIQAGATVAMVTDAGMPCVSDPGYKMVKAAVSAGIEVTVCPGASAVITAISLSGLPSASFAFYGFLPRKHGDIISRLTEISLDAALLAVFYEAPSRITETLKCIAEVFPDSNVAVCNDLTKKFERVYRGVIKDVIEQIEANEKSDKGEYTIVVEKCLRKKEERPFHLESYIVNAMIENECDIKTATAIVAKELDVPKKQVYAASLNLKSIF